MAALASITLQSFRPQPLKLTVIAPTDAELVDRAKAGDNNAFRILVERHEKSMARTVAAMLGPSAEVDDVVQETFIRFYRSLARFRGESSTGTYLKRIAINLSLDTLRRRKRETSRYVSRDDDRIYLPEPAIESVAEDAFDNRRLIDQALDALRPHHRSVVVLRLIDGYSTKEAARILKIPSGTVLSRLSRAIGHLREILAPALEEEK